MRQWGFVPGRAKSVEHEARNGMLLCKNHHHTFDNFFYCIRWTPEVCSPRFYSLHSVPIIYTQIRRFVLINHSQESGLEQWHGKAINLRAGDDRLPFYSSFLVHEKRVRGWWPFRTDRPIPMPIFPQDWIPSDEDNDDNGDDRLHHHKNPNIANQGDHHSTLPGGIHTGPLPVASNVRHEHHDLPSTNAASGQQPKTFTPTDPFANPADLEALVASFPKQPSWKAAVREGETWDGTAEENIAKWQGLTGGPSG